MKAYTRPELNKVLAQEYGHTYRDARVAMNRYIAESNLPFDPWFVLYYGDVDVIAEFIHGTTRYWLPKSAYAADTRSLNEFLGRDWRYVS